MARRPARPAGSTPRTGEHVPVLLDRVRELLAPALATDATPAGGADGRRRVLVDGTLGLAGHAEALLADHPDLLLVGVDRDPAALARARARLAAVADRVRLVRTEFDEVPGALEEAGVDGADGVLLDLGVSSLQLDDAARGFAYAQDAPLDMRMDPDLPVSAADVVNTWEQRDLVRVLRQYGEEPSAARIVRALVRARAEEPITTTGRLADLVREAVPAAVRRHGGHPAKRTFQALRIEVNGELEILRRALPRAVAALRPGGVIVVLSYHSLEDRIVKRALADAARSTTPEGLPVELPGHEPRLRLLTRGAEGPSEAEVLANPRATSVRLRAAQALVTSTQEETR